MSRAQSSSYGHPLETDMKETSFASRTSPLKDRRSISLPLREPAAPMNRSPDDLLRVFNTAMVSTRVEGRVDPSAELAALVRSPAFQAILETVGRHATHLGISERQAAEEVIKTFRKMDEVWGEYLFQQGVGKIRGQ